MDVITDGVDGRVVLANQLRHILAEAVGRDGDRRVADAQLADGGLDLGPLFVTRIVAHHGEAVDVVSAESFGRADQRIRIDPAAHAESQRNV